MTIPAGLFISIPDFLGILRAMATGRTGGKERIDTAAGGARALVVPTESATQAPAGGSAGRWQSGRDGGTGGQGRKVGQTEGEVSQACARDEHPTTTTGQVEVGARRAWERRWYSQLTDAIRDDVIRQHALSAKCSFFRPRVNENWSRFSQRPLRHPQCVYRGPALGSTIGGWPWRGCLSGADGCATVGRRSLNGWTLRDTRRESRYSCKAGNSTIHLHPRL